MYIDNPLLQFDFDSLKQGYGELQGIPSLVGREQTLQPFPQLQDSGFNQQVQPGPVYALAPQRPNAPLYGDAHGGMSPGDIGQSNPGNVSLGTVGIGVAGMLGATSPLGVVGAIAGIVGQSMANTQASSFEPSIFNSLLGIQGPEGVDFGDIDALGLGFGGGGGGFGSDSPGGLGGGPGDADGASGIGSDGGMGTDSGGVGATV